MSLYDEQEIEALHNTVRIYSTALEESLKLQSHYAELLNMWDGGKRMKFPTIYEWIERLKKTGTIHE